MSKEPLVSATSITVFAFRYVMMDILTKEERIKIMRQNVVNRFLKYVTFDTTADPKNANCPSTEGQRVFGNYLVEELKSLGLEDAKDIVEGNSKVIINILEEDDIKSKDESLTINEWQ